MRKYVLGGAGVIALGMIAADYYYSHRPVPGVVTTDGFTMTSANITLPADDPPFPDGPNADVINANCTSCHSASMALTQPRLKPEQWEAIVKKMREAYKAPIAESDVPAILVYLEAMPGQGGGR